MVDAKINEEIANISRDKHIANLEREKKGHIEAIKFHEDLLVRLYKEKEILNTRHELQMKGFKIISPNWEYEKDQAYVDTLKFDLENQLTQNQALLDRNEEQIKMTILKQNEALESNTVELERLNGEKKNE